MPSGFHVRATLHRHRRRLSVDMRVCLFSQFYANTRSRNVHADSDDMGHAGQTDGQSNAHHHAAAN